MSRKFLTALDLARNELQNGVIQNLAAAPSTPVKGQLYYDSTGNVLYWWDGTVWQAAKGGTVAFGSVPAETTFGLARSDGVAATAARSDHTHGSPAHNAAEHATIPLSALAVPTGPVSMNGQTITNVGTPVSANDAANKSYVDNTLAGLSWKDPVRVATTANITLSGTQTIDGVAVVANDRVLVKDQTTASGNGIYVVAAGAWTRATDADTAGELEAAAVFVQQGTANADEAWVMTADPPITVGTTNLTWVQFAGGGTVTAGAGMTQSGNTLNVIAGDTSLTVSADAVAVNTAWGDARYALAAAGVKRYAAAVGGATAVPIAHNLGTKDVVVSLYRVASPYDEVDADIEHTDTNTVTFRFTTAPAAGEYRAVVVA